MDVLNDILDVMKFKGCVYFTTQLSPPFGIEVPAYQRVARFHMAVNGSCWIRVKDDPEPLLLNHGDFVVVPHGACHILSDHPDTPVLTLDKVLEKSGYQPGQNLVFGGRAGSGSARLICGHFEFDEDWSHPLFAQLPAHIFVKGSRSLDFGWFDQALRFTAYEARSDLPGNHSIVKRLTEILFIHVIRVWSQREPRSGFVAALGDAGIGRSLRAFHERIAEKWTVADLAKTATLSRTVFNQRFHQLTGMPPMQYLTQWRIQKAGKMLLETDHSVDWIADNVGYESVAAFSRTFKRITGRGPGAHRRASQST